LQKLLRSEVVREDCGVWDVWQFAGGSQWGLTKADEKSFCRRKVLAGNCERMSLITAD